MRQILLIILLLGSSQLYSQFMGGNAFTRNAKVQIHGVLQELPVAIESEYALAEVNKQTGELKITVRVEDFREIVHNSYYAPDREINRGKEFSLFGVVPLLEVSQSPNMKGEYTIEMMARFGDIEFPAIFHFSIFFVRDRGFTLLAKGNIEPSEFESPNLTEFVQPFIVIFSFQGK